MISKSPMTSLPLFALAGFLAACEPRKDADQDAVEDTVAADEAGGRSTLLFVPAEDA